MSESKQQKANRLNMEALMRVWKEIMKDWAVKEITLPQEVLRIGPMKN